MPEYQQSKSEEKMPKIKKNLFKITILNALLFAFIFNFTPKSTGISSTAIALIASIIYALISKQFRSEILFWMRKFSHVLLALFIIAFLGVALSYYWGNYELTLINIYIKGIFTFISAYFIARIFVKNHIEYEAGNSEFAEKILDAISFSCLIQASIVIVTFLSPDFRDALNLQLTNRGNITLDHLFRFRGLHDSGGFTLSIPLGFAAGYYFFSSLKKNKFNTTIRLLAFILLLFSTTLVGRTGLIVAIIFIFVSLFYKPIKTIKSILISVILALSVGSSIFLYNPEKLNFFEENVFSYAFELFINANNGDGLRTESTDDLATMYFLPEAKNLLLGSGSFDSESNGTKRSDSGYMKMLLSTGALGAICFYLILSYSIWSNMKAVPTNQGVRFFYISWVIILFTLEAKGPVFFQNDMFRIFLFFNIALAIYRHKSLSHPTARALTASN